MNLDKWEATIKQIADESNRQPRESGKHKVLTEWRAKLEKEPTSLPPFQIDEIVREVRKRLDGRPAAARQPVAAQELKVAGAS